MKKFSTRVSTRVFPLAAARMLVPGLAAMVLGVAAAMPSLAIAAAQSVEVVPNAPDKYVVSRGDTLWDIANRFLKTPWRWPELWQLNRDQIANPHLIYPGDIVYLDTSGASPKLRLGRPVADAAAPAAPEPTVVLQPRIRAEPMERSAIPTINLAAIESFLNRPLVVDERGLREHPRIVATQEGRVFLGRGDLAYARGFSPPVGSEWHIYRSTRPLNDPDTRAPIAWEALYVGAAKVERDGDPVTLRITSTTEEVGVGDRLMPAERSRDLNVPPRAAPSGASGRIVAVSRGVAQAGRNSVVSINRGSQAGLDVGHVLAIRQRGAMVTDRQTPSGKPEMIRLPDESIGHLLVFRVFDNISYGLVMNAARPVAVGDIVNTP